MTANEMMLVGRGEMETRLSVDEFLLNLAIFRRALLEADMSVKTKLYKNLNN